MADNLPVYDAQGQLRQIRALDVNNTLVNVIAPLSVAAVATTVVDVSDGLVHTLFAANINSRKRTIQNMSAVNWLHCRNASDPATIANAGFSIPPLTYFEDPFHYTGVVTAILGDVEPGAIVRVQEA